MINKLVKFILTGFYFGNVKFMPGTLGTVPAVIIYYFISCNNIFNNIILILILFIVSIILLNYSYKNSLFSEIDDKAIVIDEIIGYLSFMIFFENNFYNIIIGFIIFRFFDILKPFPINIVDKKIKNSFGVIFDDLLAGIYSGVTLYSINYVL